MIDIVAKGIILMIQIAIGIAMAILGILWMAVFQILPFLIAVWIGVWIVFKLSH
jgi:hypothetical protein